MRTRISVIVLLCSFLSLVRAQENKIAQFLDDQSLQDSVITTIVRNHLLMSKLINKISENPQLHEMVIQHLTRLLKEKPDEASEQNQASHEMMSRYAGRESGEIKSLSKSEIDGLLNGEGVGLAMAGELNHYPGPRHVLDLADQLQLTRVQKSVVQIAFDRMHASAVELGTQLVEKERSLDRAFASSTITRESLEQLTRQIEALRGKLRDVHLAAHIEARNALSSDQIESYDRLRGYAFNK